MYPRAPYHVDYSLIHIWMTFHIYSTMPIFASLKMTLLYTLSGIYRAMAYIELSCRMILCLQHDRKCTTLIFFYKQPPYKQLALEASKR